MLMWFLLLLGAACGISGDYFCKGWVDTHSNLKLSQAIFCYLCATSLWLVLISQGKQLSRIGPIWTIMQACAAVAIGVFVFKEQLSLIHKIGLGFALVSIACLTRK